MASPVREIVVVTVGRSDFSILRPLCRMLRDDARFSLSLWVGGGHFDPSGGMTVADVEASGLPIAARIQAPPESHDVVATTASMAKQLEGFGRAAAQAIAAGKRPDLVIILGDRYEAIAAALAIVPYGIPIAHASGGSITEGAIDDMFRHALTKLSALHFCDVAEFARRIQQMGEEPWRIVTTGALGLDGIYRESPKALTEMAGQFQMDGLQKGYALVTIHPETAAPLETTSALVRETLTALAAAGGQAILTYPNADPGADLIIEAIEAAARDNADLFLVRNFGSQWFYTAMAHASIIVGNSSSGIYEAASFALPVVDIGHRQHRRYHGDNVLHAPIVSTKILEAIEMAREMTGKLSHKNLYGDGRAAERVIECLSDMDWDRLRQPKRFVPVALPFTGERLGA